MPNVVRDTGVYTLISTSINLGYLPEAAATQLVTPLASVRDMTNAAWVKTTMTNARTSVGADGAANSATRLTAAAGNSLILQTLVAAATSRTYSCMIKRVTGTGNIELTQDGATWTNISSLINSSTFTKVALNATQLNASFGIRIVTSGDAIDVDFNQFEAGDTTGVFDSRIPDNLTTRNADSLTYSTTGWLNASAGTLYAEWLQPSSISGVPVVASLNDTTTNNAVYLFAAPTNIAGMLVSLGGATQANISVATTLGATAKAVGTYRLNDFAGYANNTTMGTDVSGTIPTVTRLEVGVLAGSSALGNPIARVTYYPTRLPNATAQVLTRT